MKQTAVEWYAEEFAEHLEEMYAIKITSLTLLAKAKQMEKQQQDEFAKEFVEWCENKCVFSTSVIHKPTYKKLLEYYIETIKNA